MIVVTGTAKVKGEHKDEALTHARTLMEATRQEPGCIAYMWGEDLDDPNQVVIYEEWENADAQQAHSGSPHFAEFLTNVASLMAGASLTLYEVTNSQKLM